MVSKIEGNWTFTTTDNNQTKIECVITSYSIHYTKLYDSVAFGWLIMVMLMLKIQRVRICPFEWMDWLIIGGLVLRGLLTFSRGGILSALLGLLAVGYFLYTKDNVFRSWLSKRIVSITAGFIFIFGILVFANNLTGNYLLYRYQGKTTNEVESGVKQEKSVITSYSIHYTKLYEPYLRIEV